MIPATTRPAYSLRATLEAIAERRCPCCEGSVATSDWPSWLVCLECKCLWKTTTLNGKRYAELVRGNCREGERT